MHNVAITTFLLLLLISTVVAILTTRIRGVPYSTALVLSGLVISLLGFATGDFLDPEVVIQVFLPILLFEAAVNTDLSHLREHWKPVLSLSTLGVVISALATGLAIHWWLGTQFLVAFLFGALIAPTDTMSVIAVFRFLRVPLRLQTIVEGESLFNDGVAIVLFQLILGILIAGQFDAGETALALIISIGGGALIGASAGLVAASLIQRINNHLVQILITTVVTFGLTPLMESIGASGVIAIVAAGLVVGQRIRSREVAPSGQIALISFWEYAVFFVTSTIFLLIGMHPDLKELSGVIPLILIAFVAVHLGRAAAIYPIGGALNWVGERMPAKWLHILVLGNVKGALSMALAISLPAVAVGRELILALTFGVALISLVGQGLSLYPILDRLRIRDFSESRHASEIRQGALMAARAAQDELKRIFETGMVTREIYDQLRSHYQVTLARLERELRDLVIHHQELETQGLSAIRRQLLVIEKRTILSAESRKLISTGAARELIAAVDDQLVDSEKAADLS
ncbi:MAG: sodium:proton antiporter [Acidobacteria bacterium]|nr:sodium:proton antiporter [Acidobacteriota bacterium]